MSIDWDELDQQPIPKMRSRRPPSALRPRSGRPPHRPPIPWWRTWDGLVAPPLPSSGVASAYPAHPHAPAFRALVEVCEARSGLLGPRKADRSLPALLALSAHHRDWLRPPVAWEPPDDPDRQLGDLIRHLLAVYDVPRFLDAAWTEGLTARGATWQGWFRRLGIGRNLRESPGLPMPVSKRESHQILQAPDDLDIPSAFRFGQVVALGGDSTLARSLAATRLHLDFNHHEFWASVIRWFVAHPTVDPADHAPIVDFLHHEKFVPQVANPRTCLRGQPREPILTPPQPDLCMKRRDPTALLRAATRWRREFNARPVPIDGWPPSAIAPLAIVEGFGADQIRYQTTELIGTDELGIEGQTMNHCVASYATTCRAGLSSIWSLTAEDPTGRVRRVLTLQVGGAGPAVVQALGPNNRQPTLAELTVLLRWAVTGGPQLAPHVRFPLDLWENRRDTTNVIIAVGRT